MAIVTFLALSLWAPAPGSEGYRNHVGYWQNGWDWSPSNLLPESDWSNLGVSLLYGGAQRTRILRVTRPLYNSIASDPGYAALPHVLHRTALDLAGLSNGAGHCYYFCPSGPGPHPALIFLHGAMGNMQCYLQFWQQWAQPRGYIVICPTFGFGSWWQPGGGETAQLALEEACKRLPIDPHQIHLAALSNGATGAVRLVRRCPDRIRSLLLISPVLQLDQMESSEFRNWSQTHPPTVVLEGDQDTNVPPDRVQVQVSRARHEGLRCELQLFEGEDHFLMFSSQKAIYEATDKQCR